MEPGSIPVTQDSDHDHGHVRSPGHCDQHHYHQCHPRSSTLLSVHWQHVADRAQPRPERWTPVQTFTKMIVVVVVVVVVVDHADGVSPL